MQHTFPGGNQAVACNVYAGRNPKDSLFWVDETQNNDDHGPGNVPRKASCPISLANDELWHTIRPLRPPPRPPRVQVNRRKIPTRRPYDRRSMLHTPSGRRCRD